MPIVPHDSIAKKTLAAHFELPSEAIPAEFFDFIEIIKMGSIKYSMNNWLEPEGTKSSEKDMHASMFRHLAQSSTSGGKGELRLDTESGLDHLLHLITRAQMLYTRRKRMIRSSEDK